MENFEDWLYSHKKDFKEDVYGLFSDSLKCYKMDIDRPAYLLAYLGMMLYLRGAIMRGKKPDAFEEKEWQSILRDIQNDNNWESETMDRVKQCNKGKIVLCMPEEVRKKFEYWRDLRNVCAHYKEYRFIKAHTLTLYSFISQYLLTISVEGGKETLLHEFEIYFNPAFTSPNEPIQPLLAKIKDMVEEKDKAGFVVNVLKLANGSYGSDVYEFLRQLYDTESIRDTVKAILWKEGHVNKRLRLRFISRYPDLVLALYADKDKKYIRELWYTDIKECSNILSVYCQLLEGDLVPKNDIEETNNHILRCLYKSFSYCNLSIDEISVLRSNNYFTCFLDAYLSREYTSREYKEICYKTDFYMFHINMMQIDECLASHIVEVFASSPYPYTLEDRVKKEFLDGDLPKREEFELQCDKLDLQIPDCLRKQEK